jgi:RNA polymerase sigma-70 factor (ECF subfamily)
MLGEEPETVELLRRIGDGDQQALGRLLTRHRVRLRRMVSVRMDARLSGRVDPSDVVQEALMAASRKIEAFLRDRPLPFYPWLRQLAWNRLTALHRRHLHTQKRCLSREDRSLLALSDGSAQQLVDRLVAGNSSPSGQSLRREIRDRVRRALARLAPRDREILVLRHLEELRTAEIAAIFGLTEEATRKRQVRALERLHKQLGDNS